MVQVLLHGDAYHTSRCCYCSCVFSFTDSDVVNYIDKYGNLIFTMHCPECGHELNPEDILE